MKRRTPIDFLAGMGSVLRIAYFPNYIYPEKNEFGKDKIQMSKDAAVFSNDLYTVTNKEYGKISLNED